MRRLAPFALMCVAACGVRFSNSEAGAGGGAGSDEGAGATGGKSGTGGDAGGGGDGGGGGAAGPLSLTVCATSEYYGLNGTRMPGNDDKLVNPANFGPGAPVAVTLSVVFLTPVEVTQSNLDAQGCDIFQIGIDVSDSGSGNYYYSLTPEEVAELRAWSLAPGHVVLGFQGYASGWGLYVGSTDVQNPMVMPNGGSPLFNGPFGDATGFAQGGTYQGKYESLPVDQYCPLIEDFYGTVVGFADRPSGDVFLADVDIVSTLGGVSEGNQITTNNDAVFANLYAMLVSTALADDVDPCP